MSFWLADVNFFENGPLSLRLIKKELYFLRTETFRRNTCKKENSEFNTGRCILQKWHHSTIDQNYSLSLLSASDQHIPHEEFRPYLMPYWDGSLCEPHKDMRYACRKMSGHPYQGMLFHFLTIKRKHEILEDYIDSWQNNGFSLYLMRSSRGRKWTWNFL